MREVDEEAQERASQLERLGARGHADVLEPRVIAQLHGEEGIGGAAGARDAKLGVRHGGEVRIERPRKVRAIADEPDERLGRRVDVLAACVMRAPVDVALEVARLAREAAERARARVLRRHERREEERLAEPRGDRARRFARDRHHADAARRSRAPRRRGGDWPSLSRVGERSIARMPGTSDVVVSAGADPLRSDARRPAALPYAVTNSSTRSPSAASMASAFGVTTPCSDTLIDASVSMLASCTR